MSGGLSVGLSTFVGGVIGAGAEIQTTPQGSLGRASRTGLAPVSVPRCDRDGWQSIGMTISEQ